MTLKVETMPDVPFLDKLERAFDKEPLFKFLPEHVARVYQIAGLSFTADQFACRVERLEMPNMREIIAMARANLAGIDPRHYEAVMLDRACVAAWLAKQGQRDLGDMIAKGLHRTELISEESNDAQQSLFPEGPSGSEDSGPDSPSTQSSGDAPSRTDRQRNERAAI